MRKVLSTGDAFLVLGTAWKAFFGTIIGAERITVLPDAIRIPAAEPKQYGVHKILFLGRLCKAKGIGELLTVMPELREKYPDVHLYLGGIWEDEELKDQAQAMTECVTDLGLLCLLTLRDSPYPYSRRWLMPAGSWRRRQAGFPI